MKRNGDHKGGEGPLRGEILKFCWEEHQGAILFREMYTGKKSFTGEKRGEGGDKH